MSHAPTEGTRNVRSVRLRECDGRLVLTRMIDVWKQFVVTATLSSRVSEFRRRFSDETLGTCATVFLFAQAGGSPSNSLEEDEFAPAHAFRL